jgi:hypothetical protein
LKISRSAKAEVIPEPVDLMHALNTCRMVTIPMSPVDEMALKAKENPLRPPAPAPLGLPRLTVAQGQQTIGRDAIGQRRAAPKAARIARREWFHEKWAWL